MKKSEIEEVMNKFYAGEVQVLIATTIVENGIENYLKDLEEHENKKAEFIELFKECYDDIVKIMEFDPHQRVAVNCYTCIKGMDLSKKYGKPKK